MTNRNGMILVLLGAFLITFPMLLSMQITRDLTLFTSTFESGDFSEWNNNIVTTAGDTATVILEDTNYIANFTVDASSTDEKSYVYANIPSTYSIVSSSMSIRYDQSRLWRLIMQHFDATGTTEYGMANLYVGADTYRLWFQNGSSATYVEGTAPTTLGVWYQVELYTKVGDGDGENILWVDGAEIIRVSGLSNVYEGNVGTVKVGLCNVPHYTPEPTSISIDNVVIEAASSTHEPPPTQYQLTVNSNPISEITYTIDSQIGVTGSPLILDEGSYIINMPSTVELSGDSYTFKDWNDGSTNPTKSFTLIQNTTFAVTYELVPTPPLGSGYLEVHAYLDETEVNAQFEVVGVATYETTVSGTTLELPIGTYTVEASYGSNILSETVIVAEGLTVRLDFQFTTSVEPTFNISLFAQFGGVGLVAIGIFMMRRKKP